MHQKKGKRILIYFLLLLIFASINNINLNKNKFSKVENINITGLNNFDNEIILNNLKKFKFRKYIFY